MVPLDLFAKRAFAVTNGVSFFMYFGTFGSIFLITQFVQQVMGYAPFDAGVRMLVWTGATAITSPIAGILAERRGPRTLMALGLALQAVALAWLAWPSASTRRTRSSRSRSRSPASAWASSSPRRPARC